MSIDFWENRTKVMTPTGHEGKVIVTRRERKLLAAGKLDSVDVLGTDGLRRVFKVSELELIPEPEGMNND